MKRNNRMSASVYIVLGLAAIGVFFQLLQHPSTMIIPVVVFGLIFILYKFPPASLRSRPKVKQPVKQAKTQQKPKPRSKTVPFRVIEGGKDDDSMPKYH
ncbi:hypothetical protein [Paenibacillus beijingensis]|uniref:Uncharacterized protein n=1 Tax=Paenibacillus beijingensis TaxID=1126833 RepID=A0A0D5NQL6_9BACL|nr:hypothetical protein [Paenibacillus beijingensis]AJY77277.1 hypothetical protein VN24_25355 [Paenibacillus beijingensis]